MTFELLKSICNEHGFECEQYLEGTKTFVRISQTEGGFVQAANWEENWNRLVPRIFPKAKVQSVNLYNYNNKVAVFLLGDIMEILRE